MPALAYCKPCSIQQTLHCPGQAGELQIHQVHWKTIVMNPQALGFSGVGTVWEYRARQCHKVVDGVDIGKVDLTSAGEAATRIAIFQQTDRKPVNSTTRPFTNNDCRSRHCSRVASTVSATKSKQAAAKFYSESAAQRQQKRKRGVNCQTDLLDHESTVERNLAAIPF